MITRKTSVNSIEIMGDGSVGVKISLQLIEDGEVIDNKWHRTIIQATESAQAQLNMINDHLASMKVNPLSEEDIERVARFHAEAQK